MTETSTNIQAGPVKKRLKVLDALRGFALLGVCLANYKELTLYAFYDVEHTTNVQVSMTDQIANFLMYLLVDGKFYTIFSVLFGIGFYIIISKTKLPPYGGGPGRGLIFYRRMLLLFGFGFAHLMLLWSGDILMLYAAIGMILPLFWHCSPKAILRWAGFFLFLPVITSSLVYVLNLNPCTWFFRQMNYWQTRFGIGDWGTWLRESQSYSDLLKFLVMGAFERMTEFISSDRYFKVLGLFLVGLWIGKKRIFANIEEHRQLLKRIMLFGFAIGIPFAFVHAYDAVTGYQFAPPLHTIIEMLNIYPLGLAYMAAFALYGKRIFTPFTYPGKMALTCYISQSAIAIVLFYGVGFGWGMQLTMPEVIGAAIGVYLFEVICSFLWLRYFAYGPLEWIWRMLTYGKRLPLIKSKNKEITRMVN